MAREHARILTRIWSDLDWRELPPAEQRLYFLLLSQGNVTQAGVLPLQVRKWAKGSKHTSEEDIAEALAVLAAERFVVVDEDTEEVLIRSFIRNDGVLKIPNVLKAALRAATAVESSKLRAALAVELRRLRRREASEVADELVPNPSGTCPTDWIANPSGTNAEPVETGSGTRSEPVKVRDGIPEPAGEGVGEGEGEPLVGGWVGEGARANEPADEHDPAGQRPPTRCPKHRNDENPPNCRACGRARETAERYDDIERRVLVEARSAEARQRAADRAAAIANCALCDPDGYAGKQICDHDADSAARAARGRALVQAELGTRRQP